MNHQTYQPLSDLTSLVLNISIHEVDMGRTQMGILPGEEGAVNVCLVKGDDYKPTTEKKEVAQKQPPLLEPV